MCQEKEDRGAKLTDVLRNHDVRRWLAGVVVIAVVGAAGSVGVAAARAPIPTPRVGVSKPTRAQLLAGKRVSISVRAVRRARVTIRIALVVGGRAVTAAPARTVTVRQGRPRRVAVSMSRASRNALRRCAAPAVAVLQVSARARGAHGRRGRLARARVNVPCARTSVGASGLDTPPSHELAGMTQLDRLPVLDPLTLIAGASSHARDGSNLDTGASLERTAQGGYVLMEAQGPGAITRIWMTGALGGTPSGEPSAFGNLQFFFDGEARPRIDLPATTFYSGESATLPSPLCGDYSVSSGGNYCDLRMPYATSVRVVSTGAPAYYDIGYESYPAGTSVTSLDPSADDTVKALAAAAALFARSGTDPAILPAGATHAGSALLPAAARVPVVHIAHGGAIRAIRVSLDRIDDATLQSVWLKAYWDDQGEPAISAPLADLFLSGAGERAPAKGLLAGYLPDQHAGYLYFPMPFAASADVELVNRSGAPVTATWSVEESPVRYAGLGSRSGYFHATYNADPATRTGIDYTLLDATGAGKIVGVSYTAQGELSSALTTFMEGDERVYFDGSRTPAIYGTGTEDIFGGAYYYTAMFALPDHGATVKEDVSPDVARTSQYRLLLSDPWPFRDGIHFGVEHGGGNGQQTSARSVVFWYGSGRRGLRQTASFDVGDPAAAAQAGYAGPGTAASLTAFFEGDHDGNVSPAPDHILPGSQPPPDGTDPMGESVTAAGRSHAVGSTIRFSIDLDAANHGAILRRMLDQGTFGQRAEVLVDGVPAGVWFTPASNSSKRWVDSDFALPAALTRGRTHAGIELHVLPAVDAPSGASDGWTDYRYVTLSVVG